MTDKDVTKQVDFQFNDDEYLPLTRCVCGHKFKPWTFTLGLNPDANDKCPNCGRLLYWRPSIRVYEVAGGKQ